MTTKDAATTAAKIIALLAEKKLTLGTAESCTGGLVAAALTEVPGASQVFLGGFITYSNAAKVNMLGVPARMIRDYGAVSQQVARAMADGARYTGRSDITLAVTGIAGPAGGTERKPVGLVYVACATSEATEVKENRFGPLSREQIRAKSVGAALELLLETLVELTGPEKPRQAP